MAREQEQAGSERDHDGQSRRACLSRSCHGSQPRQAVGVLRDVSESSVTGAAPAAKLPQQRASEAGLPGDAPAVTVTDPAVTVSAPHVTVTDPAVTVADPAVTATDPAVTVTDPAVTVTDPVVTATTVRDRARRMRPRLGRPQPTAVARSPPVATPRFRAAGAFLRHEVERRNGAASPQLHHASSTRRATRRLLSHSRARRAGRPTQARRHG